VVRGSLWDMSCPQESIPPGWKVWRNAEVPTPIVQAAIDIRDHVRQYSRGTVARTMVYGGQTIALFVSSHTWTYRNGVLVTGICIPGVSVLVQQAPGVGATATESDSIATPDPTAAVYSADVPPSSTDWPIVAVCGALVGTVIAMFWGALKAAGKAKRR
jgi:hypothetical protein